MTNQEKFLLVVVLVAAGLGAGFYVQNTKKSESTTAIVQQVQSQPVPALPTTAKTNTPAETIPTQIGGTNTGTTQTETPTNKRVSSTVTYQVPEGHSETLAVNVTLTNGLISDISFSENATNRESSQYYQKFSSQFPKSSLMGKPLSTVSLSRVGGASLTTNAFNQAISKL